MDLNDIKLNPSVAAALYRFSLVESDIKGPALQAAPVTTSSTKSLKYLGENKKNILIVVKHEEATHLPDEELSFLTNILAACHLSLGDVAIVNTSNYPSHTYKEYIDEFRSRVVLLFGTDPLSFGLPLDFPQFQVQSFAKCTFLYSPALNEYDKLLKSKLWVCLKRIFVV
jgi:hypothetical protein